MKMLWEYSQDIGMVFGIKKCAMLEMENVKRQLTDGMELPNKEKIRTLREKQTYKYFWHLGSWHYHTRED